MKPEPLFLVAPFFTPQTRSPPKQKSNLPTPKKIKIIRPYIKGLSFNHHDPTQSDSILISLGGPGLGWHGGLGLRFGPLPFVPCSFFNPQGGSILAAPRFQGLKLKLFFCFYLFCHLFFWWPGGFLETHVKTKVLSVWRQYCQHVFSDLRLLLLFFYTLGAVVFLGPRMQSWPGTHTQPIGPECDCQLLGILDGLRF